LHLANILFYIFRRQCLKLPQYILLELKVTGSRCKTVAMELPRRIHAITAILIYLAILVSGWYGLNYFYFGGLCLIVQVHVSHSVVSFLATILLFVSLGSSNYCNLTRLISMLIRAVNNNSNYKYQYHLQSETYNIIGITRIHFSPFFNLKPLNNLLALFFHLYTAFILLHVCMCKYILNIYK